MAGRIATRRARGYMVTEQYFTVNIALMEVHLSDSTFNVSLVLDYTDVLFMFITLYICLLYLSRNVQRQIDPRLESMFA